MAYRTRQHDGRMPRQAGRLVESRAAELVAAGMEASRALDQAKAEFEKGVLAPGCCRLVDLSEGSKRKSRREA